MTTSCRTIRIALSGEESLDTTDDPHEEGNVTDIKSSEILSEMLNSKREDKLGTQRVKIVPEYTENINALKRIEDYKENRRRELLARYGPEKETSAAKPLKSCKRREDLRGGGSAPLPTYLKNRTPENQVPSSDTSRYISRRDKTESGDSSGGKAEGDSQSVTVRETRTSRLRAAARLSATEQKATEKEKGASTSSPASSTTNSLNRKEIDKSHKRKSYLNRSHTSEEVYEDVRFPGGSSVNRRRPAKDLLVDARKIALNDMPTSTDKVEVPKLRNGSVGKNSLSRSRVMESPKNLLDGTRNENRTVPNIERNGCIKRQSSTEENKWDPSRMGRPEDRMRRRLSHERDYISAGNSPVKKEPSERSKIHSDDFARRAQLLAATTLKMINRLDEINRNSGRSPTTSSMAESPADRTSWPKARTYESTNKSETRRGSISDSTAKPQNSSTLNRRNSQTKLGTPTRTFAFERERPSHRQDPDSRPTEAARPSSILKKKVAADTAPICPENRKSKPVSILKRKSLSQDESHSKTCSLTGPPVTFSLSVVENENSNKRQGILKKRRSLDENEVLRRRNFLPDGEFKPILKNQRRSSLEDLSGRSKSPDYLPQSILKRKSSRDEEPEEPAESTEPQSILKRTGHVKIADNALRASAAEIPTTENVRPILKKKSSSEEHSTPDLSLSEVPRPILKKKSSLEVEEMEDKPKKPILKTSSRKASTEESDVGKRARTADGIELEHMKPILKRENGRSKEGELDKVEGVVLRRLRPNRFGRPLSSSDVDGELHAIFNKRRSLEFSPSTVLKLDWELRRAKSTSLNGGTVDDVLRRSSSVSEKIWTLETFLKMGRNCRTESESPSSSTEESPRRSSPQGAVPKSRTQEGSSDDPKLTYSDSVSPTAALNRPFSKEQVKESERRDGSESDDEICRCRAASSPVRLPSLGTISDAGRYKARGLSDASSSPTGSSNDQYDSEYYSAVESCTRKLSCLDVEETNCAESMEKANELADEIFQLQKSGSVTAKTSLFQELDKKFMDSKEEKTIAKGNCGINRYREKRTLQSNIQKSHTQPILSQDVEEAIRNTRNCQLPKGDSEDVNFEDELSSMSLSDRVRLFNERIRKESTRSPPPPAPVHRRAPRFRTQPVTSEEVETAQGHKRTSPLEGSLMKPPDPDILGSGVPSARSLKQKIYDHASTSLHAADDKVGAKPKGILKKDARKQSLESDSSDSEIKSILKNEAAAPPAPKTEELLPRGILKQSWTKKTSSFSEESSVSDEDSCSKPKNLASILQSFEPVKAEEASDEEGSSSGIKEILKLVKNEAVARRRQSALNKLRNSSLVKSQSHSAVSSIYQSKVEPDLKLSDRLEALNGQTERLRKSKIGVESPGDGSSDGEGLRRSTTQGCLSSNTDDDMNGLSIRERLARLRKSGESDWQKRKTLASPSAELSVITSGNYLINETYGVRNRPQDADDVRSSASILADRLDKLDAAKEGWRKRVQPSDAVQFSVEGRMLHGGSRSSQQQPPVRTPLAERKKRSPKPMTFRSRTRQPVLCSVPASPSEVPNNPIARSVSAPGRDKLFGVGVVDSPGPVVSVPRTDDETFTSFFNGLKSDVVFEERLEINDEDLDVVSRMQSSQLLVQKKSVKFQRRRATLKNPLKTLAARNDLQEYTETKTGIAEKELKRLKIEKASRNSTLAIEALAGLASQEDFTSINLKKASDGGASSTAPPFKNLMLLLVKGRRHVQTRMVEPVSQSINAGDCFVLVTPKKVFNYVGEFANVIEKSRSAEISLHIQQNSDLGCSAASVITIGGGGRATAEEVREFWRLLGDENAREKPAGHPDEDEIFESAIVDTNMVYELVDDDLVPVEAFWGSIPRIEVLDSNKVLMFDFGSEFYAWIGKNVSIPNRKSAMKLAKELWEEGYNYTDCDVCPLDSYEPEGLPESRKSGPERPSWAMFAKITENMETVLFREKFLDWPDYSRIIRRGKKREEDGSDGSSAIDVKPCDAKEMLDHVPSKPDLFLEGAHLGRGIRYYEEETRRCAEVTTKDVTVWHISEYEYSELPTDSVGQFHMGDSYIVRWHYLITITGRELSGLPSKHLSVGRDRFAYFCWQGRDSPINDKGAAACLTVELDKEHGPQVRVTQGFEPPAFLNLFRGGMVVHEGRRESNRRKKWRLFICRGEDDSEASLVEVATSMRQLRSAASFVLVDAERLIIVWHGIKSPERIRKMALASAERIRTLSPSEFGFKSLDICVREELEGSESTEFLRAVSGDRRQLYFSFLDNKMEDVTTPRLFHLSSVSGEFLFTEISSPSFNPEVVASFPFLQEDLYSAPQPALFLVDTGFRLWLWQGWWEAESGEGDRGSGILRFQAERRAAMTTVISYWNLKYGSSTPNAFLVWAGLEPLMFTNLFPMWTDRDDVSEINMKEGRKPGEIVPVATELAVLTQSTYPLEQLRSRPLPDGVNPSFLEDYLEPECFQSLFGMSVEEFYNLPSWKKKKLKQDAGLF